MIWEKNRKLNNNSKIISHPLLEYHCFCKCKKQYLFAPLLYSYTPSKQMQEYLQTKIKRHHCSLWMHIFIVRTELNEVGCTKYVDQQRVNLELTTDFYSQVVLLCHPRSDHIIKRLTKKLYFTHSPFLWFVTCRKF